jgi:polyprenyl-phospho-N-acetylgalactosaminyl synthase
MISVVIPAHNEADRIRATIQRTAGFADEIIVIDDGSQDGTAEIAREAGARVIRQPANQGYIAAIKRGFSEAHGDVVVTIDADGEFPPEVIPDLVAPIQLDNADMVQGARSCPARLSERALNWLANRVAHVGDSGTGLRAIRTDLARKLEIRGACICGVMALEAAARGARIVDIPVSLEKVRKRRRIAWYHIRQFFFVLPWLQHGWRYLREQQEE